MSAASELKPRFNLMAAARGAGAARAGSGAGGDRHPVRLGGWMSRVALIAMVTPACFFAVMMILGFVTSGYDWMARYGGDLSLGPLGWIMITNFVTLGVVVLALALGLGRVIADCVSGWLATAGIGLVGVAFVTAGVCVTDRSSLISGAHTWHGTVHAVMAVVIFLIATPVAALAMARRLRGLRSLAVYCVIAAVGAPTLLVVTFVSGSILGLTDRAAIAFVLAWLTSLAVQLHRWALAIGEFRARQLRRARWLQDIAKASDVPDGSGSLAR